MIQPNAVSFPSMAGKYLLTTLGCKVNQYESQQIRELMESFGLHAVQPGETADFAVVNTCAVTTTASRKNRQAVRAAARDPGTSVIVVGCGATADADRLAKLDGVTAVIGHQADVLSELRSLLTSRFAPISPTQSDTTSKHRNISRNEVWIKPTDSTPQRSSILPLAFDASRRSIPPTLPIVKSPDTLAVQIESFRGRQRAFLKVQDGCDASCTYCIIPQLRPRLRSKPVAVVVAEAQTLVANGHKEIILTGIFLGAYGRETAIRKRFTSKGSPLAEMVRALAKVQGLHRLRLSSLEPGDVDDALLEVLATSGCCVPHLHLPLQSGSSRLLRRMNRQYTRDQYMDMVERVHRALDRPAISTDIIVGFPGETETDFQASIEVARSTGFCKIHAFPFSPRPGTAAARWSKTYVHSTEVRERMRRMAEVERECALDFRRRFIGEVERVIVENPCGPPDDAGGRQGRSTFQDGDSLSIYHGRADRYFEIHFESDAGHHAGDLVDVRVDRVTPTRTHGTAVEAPSRQEAAAP